MPVTVALTQEEEAWIADAVAHGAFATHEQAVRALFAHGMSGLQASALEDDPEQLEALRALLADAEAEAARGETIPLEEHEERMRAVVENLRS